MWTPEILPTKQGAITLVATFLNFPELGPTHGDIPLLQTPDRLIPDFQRLITVNVIQFEDNDRYAFLNVSLSNVSIEDGNLDIVSIGVESKLGCKNLMGIYLDIINYPKSTDRIITDSSKYPPTGILEDTKICRSPSSPSSNIESLKELLVKQGVYSTEFRPPARINTFATLCALQAQIIGWLMQPDEFSSQRLTPLLIPSA
jgi:hypothetical protein